MHPDGSRTAWTAVGELRKALDVVVYTDTVAGGDREALAHNVRRQVKATVTDTRYSRGWLELPVVLQRRTGGKRKKVYANPRLRGHRRVPHEPEAAGCRHLRVKVFFPGDHELEPLTTTTDTMRC